MLEFLGQRCTKALIKRGVIQQKEYPIYQYGFELLWSTVLCVLSILLLSVVFDYTRSAILFVLYFLPIRTVAGGYHTSTYGKCFILTNLIAIGCVGAAKLMSLLQMPDIYMVFVCIFVFGYMWVKSPVGAENRSSRKEIIEANKRYSHIIIMLETVVIAQMMIERLKEEYYTAIITSIVVVYMMFLSKRKED